MSRPLRIEYPGAWYHVMNRGAGRRAVFRTDAQREYFLSLLADTARRFHAEWHAYCLMSNHYHLLLRTPEANLQRIMRHVNGLYTQFYNRRQRLDGALFRGRYKAVLVEAHTYWLQLSRYIHRNPLEGHLVKALEDYPWSSYRAYIGLCTPPEWLHTDDVLNAVAKKSQPKRYRLYVEKGGDDEIAAFYDKKKRSPVLGGDAFRKTLRQYLKDDVEVAERALLKQRPSVQDIVTVTARYYDEKPESLYSSRRGRSVQSPARAMAMYLCQEVGGLRLAEIATQFQLKSYASAGSAIRNLRHRLPDDETLQSDLNNIMQDLTPQGLGKR